MTTLYALLLSASMKNPLVPVAHRQAGNDSQLRTPSPSDLEIASLKIFLALANFEAVKPPALDI